MQESDKEPPRTAEVVDFRTRRNHATIEALEEALTLAKSGELDGAIMVFRYNRRNHGVIVTGDYKSEPAKICEIAGELFVHYRKQLPRPTVIE